ncbi:MAG: AI-2E family transporter [Lentisphaeria bacterium]|nr:AI-2E family transporter [Lentisphaeria bacterium]
MPEAHHAPTTMPTTSDDSHSWAPNIAKLAFLVLTLVLFISMVYLVRFFLHAIILGVLGATMLAPLHGRVSRLVHYLSRATRRLRKKGATTWSPTQLRARARTWRKSKERLAALISVVTVFCCIVIPLAFFTVNVIKQGQSSMSAGLRWIQDGQMEKQLQALIDKYDLHDKINTVIDKTNLDLPMLPYHGDDNDALATPGTNTTDETASPAQLDAAGSSPEQTQPDLGKIIVNASRRVLSFLLDNIFRALAKTWMIVLNFFIMLFVMFYAFRDGRTFIRYLKRISPLGDSEQDEFITRIRDVAKAVLVGILGTAVTQAIIAMILFWIVGIPALFWGSVLGVCSLIPFVGTTLVWVPAVGYLLITGQTGSAIFLAICCGGIVANVDNILRPLFMSGGRTGMSYIALFFSILGGLQTFGLVGIIYGPLISGLCALCLYIFSTRFKYQPERAAHGHAKTAS